MSQSKLITWGNYSIEQPWRDFDELLESSLLMSLLSFIWFAFEGRSAPSLHLGAVPCFPRLIGGKVETTWQSVCWLSALGLVNNQVSLQRNNHHAGPWFQYRHLWVWREKKMKDLLENLSYLLVMCPLEIKLLSQNLDSRPVFWFLWGIWRELWAKCGVLGGKGG